MTASTPSATAVSLVASSIPGEFLVPDLVDAFSADQPEFAVDTVLTDSAGVFEALRAGTAEIGFAGAEPDGDDLVAEAVDTDEIVLAVPAGSELDDVVTVDTLAASTLVEREEGSGTRRSFVAALAERGTPLFPDDWAVRGSNEELLDAVAHGVGIGVVSRWSLERHARDDVRVARVAGGPITRRLYLVLRADAVHGPAATTFLEYARANAREGTE